ncbi:MAG: STAS domain-containing protein [Bacillota bacterium]|nr:STAS domain-containing protein [Bacillota bacterium]
MGLEIEAVPKGTSLFLRLRGDLDMEGARLFREAADEWLDGAGTGKLVVNLAEVAFVDSTGVGALLGRYRRLRAQRGSMVLVSPKPHVRPVLEMAGIPRLMPIVEHEAQAQEVDAR